MLQGLGTDAVGGEALHEVAIVVDPGLPAAGPGRTSADRPGCRAEDVSVVIGYELAAPDDAALSVACRERAFLLVGINVHGVLREGDIELGADGGGLEGWRRQGSVVDSELPLPSNGGRIAVDLDDLRTARGPSGDRPFARLIAGQAPRDHRTVRLDLGSLIPRLRCCTDRVGVDVHGVEVIEHRLPAIVGAAVLVTAVERRGVPDDDIAEALIVVRAAAVDVRATRAGRLECARDLGRGLRDLPVLGDVREPTR